MENRPASPCARPRARCSRTFRGRSSPAGKGVDAGQKAELERVNKLFDIELARLKRLWAGAAPGSLGHLGLGLAGEPFDELPAHDLFDRARGALHVDAVIALEQRRHLLARRPQELRDPVNPDSPH